LHFWFRRFRYQAAKCQPKLLHIALSEYAKHKKSSLVLANILQRQKCVPMRAVSVSNLANSFQVWKSISADLVRQYDGLYKNTQLISTV